MFKNRRLLVAALAVLTVSCAKRAEPPRISPEAAAAFGRAQVEGIGGSLVVDVDALRALGFRPGRDQAGRGDLVVDLAVELLPTLAVTTGEEPAAAVMARAAVLLRLLGEWATSPDVQRLGVVAKVDAVNPEASADGVLVLLAVKQGEAQSRELLQGLGASIRAAAGSELVKTERGFLCAAKDVAPEVPVQVCVSAGPGLIALGTPNALASLGASPYAPAPREPGPVLRLLARAPGLGRVEATMEGKGALKVSGRFEPDDPAVVQQVEGAIQEGLTALDAQTEKRRAVMARALEEVKGSLEKDPETPGKLKSAAAAATAEKILDPRGEYASLRSSCKVARADKALTLELTIPEGQVQRLAQLDAGLTTVGTIGVLSAIAIPNFIKYQCRSKASEGRLELTIARNEVGIYRAKHGRLPDRLEKLDYRPSTNHYTVCARSGCLPGAPPAAAAACAAALAGKRAGPKALLLCAAGDILGDGNLDVWLVEEDGVPDSFHSACQ